MKWSSFGDGLWFWDVLGCFGFIILLGRLVGASLKHLETERRLDVLRHFETCRDISWHVVKDGLSLTHMTYIWHHMTIMPPWPKKNTQRYSATGVAQPLTSLLDQPCWSTLSSPKTCNKWKPTFSPKIGPKWFSNLQFVDFKHVWNSTFVAIR
jgi:hypothetical protein